MYQGRKMELSKRDIQIINKLREVQLSYLIKPYKELTEKNRTGEIDINKVAWKFIMRSIYEDHRKDIEKTLVAYLKQYNIDVEKKKMNAVEKKANRERVKRYREKKKMQGYVNFSVNMRSSDFERLRMLKGKAKMTYEELIHTIITSIDIDPRYRNIRKK